MEDPGIDPGTSRMLSERSTIWASPPLQFAPLPYLVLGRDSLFFRRQRWDKKCQLDLGRLSIYSLLRLYDGNVGTSFLWRTSPFTFFCKSCLLWYSQNLCSPAGNRTPVSRVTGGDTHHYTTEDWSFYGWNCQKIQRASELIRKNIFRRQLSFCSQDELK